MVHLYEGGFSQVYLVMQPASGYLTTVAYATQSVAETHNLLKGQMITATLLVLMAANAKNAVVIIFALNLLTPIGQYQSSWWKCRIC